MEYTKGEWVLQRPYIDRPMVIVAGKRVGSRGVIVEVKMVKEQLANAQLIASAPDMLEALRAWDELRAMHPLDSGADIDEIFWRCCSITDKALAKAESSNA